LLDAHFANPDGIGIMWIDRGNVQTLRTFDIEQAIDTMEYLHCDYVAHFRWATHGVVDLENCHPFEIGGGAHLAHNGILNVETPDPTKSDTWHFADALRQEGIGEHFAHRKVRRAFARLVGPHNKLAVMLRSGKVARIGDWHPHNGNYWSNLNWQYNYQFPARRGLDFELEQAWARWEEEEARHAIDYSAGLPR